MVHCTLQGNLETYRNTNSSANKETWGIELSVNLEISPRTLFKSRVEVFMDLKKGHRNIDIDYALKARNSLHHVYQPEGR